MLHALFGDIEVDGLKIPFLSKEDLIKNKLSTGRKRINWMLSICPRTRTSNHVIHPIRCTRDNFLFYQ